MIQSVYHGIFRRTSTFVLAIAVGAFVFERTVDRGGDWLWGYMNQGKLWHQIAHNYVKKEEEEDDD